MASGSDLFGVLPPEARVLCACAYPVGDPRAKSRLDRIDPRSLNWDQVPPLLTQHGLGILAASHLVVLDRHIPQPIWQSIQANALAARAAALGMVAELVRIVDAFDAQGVGVMPFKGPLLGLEAYGDVGFRPFVDLDLLVHPRDIPAAIHVLESLDYGLALAFTPERERWFRRVDGDYPMSHLNTGVLVELHARPASRRFGGGLDVEHLWLRRRDAVLAGHRLNTLDAADRLYLHLLHGAKHRWERLEWVASTAALLNRMHGDISSVLRAPYSAPRPVLLGCALAHALLDAPLDDRAIRAIQGDPVVPSLVDAAVHRLFDHQRMADRGDTAGKLWFNFRVQQGVGPRLQYLYRWLAWPSPEDWAAVNLPDSCFLLYRVARPLRLLWRYMRPRISTEAVADA